nr:uncharacterized protein LOC127328548 [Lolium perenne]
MAEVTEQSLGLTDLMKQLLDGFNTLKAGQAETQEALRGIQARTDAVEARIAEAVAHTPPPPAPSPMAMGAGATMASTHPSSSSSTPPSGTTSTSLLGMPCEMGYGQIDHRDPLLFWGDAPGILGFPLPAPGTGFYGNAALWFQGVEAKGRVEHWHDMCKHQLLLYNPHIDEGHFIDEFIAGLRDEIRTAIWLHRPQELETAHLLALMQEEESAPVKKRSYSKHEYKDNVKPKWHAAKSNDDHQSSNKQSSNTKAEDKLAALKAYRREKGLCFTCGEKYSRSHKCPDRVPLHVIEELLEVLQIQSGDDSSEDSDPESEGNGSTSNTPRGSFMIVSSFINSDLVDKLQCTKKNLPPATYVVANGAKMQCTEYVPQLEWSTQGHTFQQDVKILPLGCYDMILGEDWLDDHSPMWVHWRRKRMRFTHKHRRITLNGVSDNIKTCRPVKIPKLQGLQRRGAITHMVQVHWAAEGHIIQVQALQEKQGDSTASALAPEIQQLLDAHEGLFSKPEGLPPSRTADHRIPLVPGAQPVKARPYRYTPQQKTEIENQVKEMIKSGIIRLSSSPFASPVLLVRKKDGTWRFCVDYRQLNSLTIKHKYPVPVVDELIDELAGACWFTKLDLSSGYHQILLADGEQHKTAFQTHHGLYEFLVMPFGLTNAPASFQGLMNQVFAPLLRKCVLVFVDDILIYSQSLREHVQHLKCVFELLQQNQLFLKRSKCSFALQELEYLGHIIGKNGVSTDTTKVQAVKDWPQPKNVKELRGFLGLTGYYRKFIKNYGMIAKPLTQLLCKGVLFLWGPEQQHSFQLLKDTMVQAPVLAIPDFSQSFVLETDACNTGIGAVLMQNGHPVAFLSKSLCRRNQTLSTYEKECLAIILAVDKWRASAPFDRDPA